MTTTKRAYKLQEFVAHSLSVNCLKIGRKSSRVLVTGGEDHKVNLWSIGKPDAILSLSGHSSGIDSVSFDSSEVLVAAGAASGTIKLWDLEEAKILRTLTGHRSNCISLDFHPFGEFFASGSLDTNLKIWDIRRKGCIHTYKGHSRGVNTIRFTPDGRWVVSGGEDSTVKIWDLTAGKLLHDFKCHEGQIRSIDFHPHEFLLATGSADKTVKFWDLETFELIGSAGPETTGVRCMAFNTDGRTLLCGLHENLKVFSWEPIRYHDTVDVGWSTLSDLSIHEGKLLGCSYNQSCVGVWVVDISCLEPYTVDSTTRLNDHSVVKSNLRANLSTPAEDATDASFGRLLSSQNSDPVKESKYFGRLSLSHNKDLQKDSTTPTTITDTPDSSQKINLSTGPRAPPISSRTVPNTTGVKRNSSKAQSTENASIVNKSEIIPVLVPRNNERMELASERRKGGVAGREMPQRLQPKVSDWKSPTPNENLGRPTAAAQSEVEVPKAIESSSPADRNIFPFVKCSIFGNAAADRNVNDDKNLVSTKHEMDTAPESLSRHHIEDYEARGNILNRNPYSMQGQLRGRTRSTVANLEKRDRVPNYEGLASCIARAGPDPDVVPTNMNLTHHNSIIIHEKREDPLSAVSEVVIAADEDTIAELMEQHNQFVGSLQSRLAKLQVVYQYWQRHDIKGAISALEKMADNAVLADLLSFLTEKIDIITLEICTCLLPLLTGLLQSKLDRHQDISLNMLLKLVRVFGSLIYTSLSTPTSVGVDIEAEKRMERCNLCFIELEKVKNHLPALSRRGGSIAKFAQELSLALQEVS
ncbi:PREDICTED: katanin p80 WD40 repeat-containing subunit B1 homolog isoform X1 [Nicotiana attenuata]|uniref:Katanin p80 WD40 repeat-containing subunit B1 homolog n=1 Tax=Nicotiana attenuata TaxID=49451 RepID=A0A1J6IK46_NICAT|nr:PREDICTED: katanin p80 WD40 repeat-containing subunit B1 homolog isoform X1 [Nicotiana attenuata]OIT05485.1 katanin p80 wd40 repeat-containing subunit b1-like protein [Nicotiana attenuata]